MLSWASGFFQEGSSNEVSWPTLQWNKVSNGRLHPTTDSRVPFLCKNLIGSRRYWLLLCLGFMEAARKWLRFSLHLLEWWKLEVVDIFTAATELKMPLGTGIYADGIGTYHCGTSLWWPVNYCTVPVGLLKKSQHLESSSKSQKRGKPQGLVWSLKFAEHISKHNISDLLGIRWGLQLVCWPVSSCRRWGGGSLSCNAILLHPSLAACRLAFICDPAVS